MKYSLIILTLILSLSYEVKTQKAKFDVKCIESRENDLNHPNEEPVIKHICEYENYIFKSIGSPNYKGQYYYEYELFRVDKSDTIKINNSNLFNENRMELEKIINKKLKAEYQSNLNIPEIKDCMEWIDFRYYNLNEFGISFNYKKQMDFHIDYGIGSACANVGGSVITLSFYELEDYLK